VRKYYVKDKEEFITQISYEGHFIMVHESMFSQTPSDFGLETIESTTLLSISFENLEKIFSQSAKWERLGRLIIIRTMIVKDKWQTQLVMHSPRERFIAFVNKNPELLQRVPQKFLASYLNIKPETFSRFKHLVRGSG
jgi:CRP-like cAMP-binding protein